MRFWLMCWLCCVFASAAEVESFSPQGAVTQVRQVKARFSTSMVHFGDPKLAEPFRVSCGDQTGAGRWVDDRNWVYDFDHDLPAAQSCTFNLVKGLHALDGSVLAPAQFLFSTGGPEVKEFWPESGYVSEDQVFLATFTAQPDAASLLAKTRCEVEGINERVPVVRNSDDQRDAMLAGLFGKDKHRWPPYAMALHCQRSLPAGASLSVVFDAGLATASGAKTSEKMEEHFTVRQKFTASVNCERTNSKASCVPITPISVTLSEPISLQLAQRITLTSADGKQQWAADYRHGDLLDEADASGKPVSTQLVDQVSFKPPFTERANLRLSLPAGLRDSSGRVLSNAKDFPQTVTTDNYPPLAKFSAHFGIVEREVGALPVTVRNVGELVKAEAKSAGTVDKLITMAKQAVGTAPAATQAAPSYTLPYRQLNLTTDIEILNWFKKMREHGWGVDEKSMLKEFPRAQVGRLPTAPDDRQAEVIGLPLPKSGLTVVEVESARLGARLYEKPAPMYVTSSALVTNLSVHLRRGTDDALVWVTTLDHGWPVNGATVTIYDCKGKALGTGKTDKLGVWQLGASLPKDYGCPQYAFAHLADDVSFVSSEWTDGIESWRYGIPTEGGRPDRTRYHAVLDRGLYRAGETVSMKLLERTHTAEGFGVQADAQLPKQVRLRHLGSDESVLLPVTWHGGAAEASWKVPADAKLGLYQISVERKRGKNTEEVGEAGDFVVSEFRVPLMRGTVKLPVDPVAPAKVDVTAQVQYLAGGPAAAAPVKLRALLTPTSWGHEVEGFEGFRFSTGDVAPLIKAGGTSESDEGDEDEAGDEGHELASQDAVLDRAGGVTLPLADLPKFDTPSTLMTEVEYHDPNGEVHTAVASTTIWPAALQAGLRFGTVTPAGKLPMQMAVMNLAGKPLAGRAVKAEGWVRETYSHRRRLVGGFYSYRNETRYVPLGEVCNGRTDARGMVACEIKPSRKGDVVIRVSAVDDAGHVSYAKGEMWMPGDGETAWGENNDGDRIDLIADKRAYQPGETATIRVNMPFREATALVAVERERVLSWQVVTVSAATPVVHIPILPSYGPNVFVSALVVRGRVAEPTATALVDLGKPAYKLGIIKLKVGDRGYQLDVKVAADKAVYQVRDKAHVTVAVKTADGRPMPKGAEVALAAVDEGLLQLRPNDSWKLLDAMMDERPYPFETATAQGQVIGKRHFGRKAVPVGGGGGRSSTREMFDTLLLWKGRVVLDAQGRATVDVPLNDSLTSFKIVAVATAGTDRFGTGETSIRATKDVMMFSGLANTVRQGDRYEAAVTVRNTTSASVHLSVSARVEGLPALAPQDVTLDGGAARELVWPVTVPVDAQKLSWTLEAKGDDGRVFDRLATKQAVIEAVPVRVLQATLTQLPPDYTLPLARPKDALPGRGGVRLGLSPSLAVSLDGVRDYFASYPYGCLEQLTSKAVGMNDDAAWKAVTRRLDSYLDREGFAKYFPIMEHGSPMLTAHLLRLSNESGWTLPDSGLARMQAALVAYIEGRSSFEQYKQNSTLLAQNRLDAMSALAPYSLLRPTMLDGLVIEPNRWSNVTLLNWIAVLNAMDKLPNQAAKLREARQILSARTDLSGTTLNFSSGMADDWWRELDAADATAARLLLDGLAHDMPPADVGRLARGFVARQHRGHWDTTVGNAWGALAIRRFAEKMEAGAPTGVLSASLGTTQQLDWAKSPKGGTLDLPWPDQAGTLTVQQQGSGKPWAVVQARAAMPLTAPLNSGYRIEKQWTPVEAKGKGYTRGDVWRVRLTIDAQADAGWVVVDDPIPAGATLLGRGLGGESTLLSRNEKHEGDWPIFEERGETAYHAYYDGLSKGTHVIEYTIRLGTRGEFKLPATHVEAMYAPERFGETPNPAMKVE